MNRRYFLMGSLATAGATAVRAQSIATIGAGVIGTGNRGSADLASVMAQPGAKVVALCDIKPDRLDKAATAAAMHKPSTYRDYHELLARKDMDAVVIATPCDLHVESRYGRNRSGMRFWGISRSGRCARRCERAKTFFIQPKAASQGLSGVRLEKSRSMASGRRCFLQRAACWSTACHRSSI